MLRTNLSHSQILPVFALASRAGIIQELTFDTPTFNALGIAVNGARFQTFDSSDNSYQRHTGGGTWDSNWDMTRIDIFAEEGKRGPVDDNFLRFRLRYDQDYAAINGSGINAPRNNIGWPPGGNGVRYPDDKEFWYAFTHYFPADYEIDTSSSDNREILLQMHNAAGGGGHANMKIGSSVSEQGKLNIFNSINATSDGGSGATTIKEVSADVSDLKGEFITYVFNCRFNPFTVETTVTAAMGRHPQVGETFLGNLGKFNVWMTVPTGVSITSSTLGTVTNPGATKMMKVADNNNVPVGRVPSWRNGITDAAALSPAFNVYKPGWMNSQPFASRPTIPHSHSTKAGPIVLYLGQARMGNDTSNYQSVHPEREAEPV